MSNSLELQARLWLCALLSPAGDACRAAGPPASEEFWEATGRIATGHGLAPLPAVQRSKGLWPAAQQARLERARKFTLAANLVQLDAGARALTVLKDTGIHSAPIKGLALLRAGIYEPGERAMSDIDLMIRVADLEAARDALVADGWEAIDTSPAARRRHHHWVFRLSGNPAVGLDLHWTPTSGERIMPAWDALGMLPGEDSPLTVQLYFLATNGARHGYTGKLLFLYDLAKILQTRGDQIDWGHLKLLATQTGTCRAVALALACAREVFGVEPPAYAGFDSGALERRLVTTLWPESRWETRWGRRMLRLLTSDSAAGTVRTGFKGMLNLLRS